MRNQNGHKIIQLNIPYDKYGRYGELCSKILYKFRSNLNLPGELNKKHTANLHHINSMQ